MRLGSTYSARLLFPRVLLSPCTACYHLRLPSKQMSLVSTSTSIQPRVPEPQGNDTDTSCTIKLKAGSNIRLLGLVAFPFELFSLQTTPELHEAYWDTSFSRSYSLNVRSRRGSIVVAPASLNPLHLLARQAVLDAEKDCNICSPRRVCNVKLCVYMNPVIALVPSGSVVEYSLRI